jgi:hypothetical protein
VTRQVAGIRDVMTTFGREGMALDGPNARLASCSLDVPINRWRCSGLTGGAIRRRAGTDIRGHLVRSPSAGCRVTARPPQATAGVVEQHHRARIDQAVDREREGVVHDRRPAVLADDFKGVQIAEARGHGRDDDHGDDRGPLDGLISEARAPRLSGKSVAESLSRANYKPLTWETSVSEGGLEPPCPFGALAPQASASAYSATRTWLCSAS